MPRRRGVEMELSGEKGNPQGSKNENLTMVSMFNEVEVLNFSALESLLSFYSWAKVEIKIKLRHL
jgi:hypothetical protein